MKLSKQKIELLSKQMIEIAERLPDMTNPEIESLHVGLCYTNGYNVYLNFDRNYIVGDVNGDNIMLHSLDMNFPEFLEDDFSDESDTHEQTINKCFKNIQSKIINHLI